MDVFKPLVKVCTLHMIEAELNKSPYQNTILLGMVCGQLYRNEWLECQICVYHSILMCLKLGLY